MSLVNDICQLNVSLIVLIYFFYHFTIYYLANSHIYKALDSGEFPGVASHP